MTPRRWRSATVLVEDRQLDPGVVGAVARRPDDGVDLELAAVFEANRAAIGVDEPRLELDAVALLQLARARADQCVASTKKPLLFGLQAIANNWPAATDNVRADPDSDYELIAPQIFRLEYFYLLKTGAISNLPSAQGMQDVAALVVTLAAIDPKSRVLLSDGQIATLITRLGDFNPATHTNISDLVTSWQTTLDGTTDMVRPAIAGIRIYQRSFDLLPAK